jgi:hypothetical protein
VARFFDESRSVKHSEVTALPPGLVALWTPTPTEEPNPKKPKLTQADRQEVDLEGMLGDVMDMTGTSKTDHQHDMHGITALFGSD